MSQRTGKYSVAGVRGYPPIDENIDHYHYDYGLQLAKLGYVAACPDCRGFGRAAGRPRRHYSADPMD